jgi:hypothetical protein
MRLVVSSDTRPPPHKGSNSTKNATQGGWVTMRQLPDDAAAPVTPPNIGTIQNILRDSAGQSHYSHGAMIRARQCCIQLRDIVNSISKCGNRNSMFNLKLLTIVLTGAVCTWAQSQMATSTSSAPFELRGAQVTPGQGVPSWPVMPGDTIKAGSGSVTTVFSNGSSIVLDPNSSAKVDLSGQTPVFQLQTGALHYSLKSASAVKLTALGTPVTTTHLTGLVKISNGHVTSGWWTPGHTAAVVTGAAASTALGVGVTEATSGGTTVSPSH